MLYGVLIRYHLYSSFPLGYVYIITCIWGFVQSERSIERYKIRLYVYDFYTHKKQLLRCRRSCKSFINVSLGGYTLNVIQLNIVCNATSSCAAHSVSSSHDGAEHTKHIGYSVVHFLPLLSFGMALLYHQKPDLSNPKKPLHIIGKIYTPRT